MIQAELLLQQHGVPPQIKQLIAKELKTHIIATRDTSVRIKSTDRCGLTCVFCHNEGTPVANQQDKATKVRVSIYESSNGCTFQPGTISADESFIAAITSLRQQFHINEIHWTGGEPMLNKDIVKLSKIATDMGFTVKMTSNGEVGDKLIPALADAGVCSINYSIFGTTPEDFLTTQSSLKQYYAFASNKISKAFQAIDASIHNDIDVKVNIVVSGENDFKRVTDLINRFGNDVTIRLLPDFSKGLSSVMAIYQLLSQLNADPVSRHFIVGSSNYRSDFLTPDGVEIGFKQIDRITLPQTCSTCPYNNDKECAEGYYGLRLYIDQYGNYQVGVCIQRMDLTMPISDFMSSSLAREVASLQSFQHTTFSNSY